MNRAAVDHGDGVHVVVAVRDFPPRSEQREVSVLCVRPPAKRNGVEKRHARLLDHVPHDHGHGHGVATLHLLVPVVVHARPQLQHALAAHVARHREKVARAVVRHLPVLERVHDELAVAQPVLFEEGDLCATALLLDRRDQRVVGVPEQGAVNALALGAVHIASIRHERLAGRTTGKGAAGPWLARECNDCRSTGDS